MIHYTSGIGPSSPQQHSPGNGQKPKIDWSQVSKPGDAARAIAILRNMGQEALVIGEVLVGMKPGERLLVKVRRGKNTYEFEVTLGKRPAK